MNPNYFRIAMPVLFLPFKLKANTTLHQFERQGFLLFLPFKLKANTTLDRPEKSVAKLFLPFKLKANTTPPKIKDLRNGCFCLSN